MRQPTTLCPQGHERSISSSGRRRCFVCDRERSKRIYAAKIATKPPRLTPAQRLMRFVEVGPGGCWEWTGARSRTGYGTFAIKRRTVLAHRASYLLNVGPIPDGLQLDHLCRNRGCVNPAHLEPVTARENTMRGESRAADNARRMHCIRGHEFLAPSVPGRRRQCRICKTALARQRRAA